MPYIDFDGLNLYYDTAGSGHPLLLLHGNAVSSKMFLSEIEFYQDYFRVIYLDYPGHGQSGRLQKFNNDFWSYNAEAANKLINNLSIEELYVIGTSGGALVGLNLAGLIPDKIKKMICDSFFGFNIYEDEARKIINDRVAAKKDVLSSSFWEFMHGSDWETVIDNDLDLMLRFSRAESPIIKTDLASIRFPVLGTASEEDELIPNITERMGFVLDAIPFGRLMISKKGKHPFMITQKQKFRDIAIQFLIAE